MNAKASSSKRQASEPPQPDYSSLEKLNKRQLEGIQRYNARIIEDAVAKKIDFGKSYYMKQVMNEQIMVEARLAQIEQAREDFAKYPGMPSEPEYVLTTKQRAANRPVNLQGPGGRSMFMSLEEAAALERHHAQARGEPRPTRHNDFGGLTEKQKNEMIMQYMNHRDSSEDEDEEMDEDEEGYWENEGQQAEDTGAVGGEFIDTADLSNYIQVDPERIAPGAPPFGDLPARDAGGSINGHFY